MTERGFSIQELCAATVDNKNKKKMISLLKEILLQTLTMQPLEYMLNVL